jgi:hypothetical protein
MPGPPEAPLSWLEIKPALNAVPITANLHDWTPLANPAELREMRIDLLVAGGLNEVQRLPVLAHVGKEAPSGRRPTNLCQPPKEDVLLSRHGPADEVEELHDACASNGCS